MTGGLVVDVRLRRGTLDLDAAISVAHGEIVAIVGPNGAGKSTLLQIVAGLLSPDSGTVTLADRILCDTATGSQAPPEDRGIGMVFQDYLLFDHLSVQDNVAFGPRSRGASRADAARQARQWLQRMDLAALADATPTALSGGQQQRVALARALAWTPRCLLLDEPLAALDVQTRSQVRRELCRHLAEFAGPVLLVTHEPLEALAMADRLVVLEAGRITQTGDPAAVASRPRSDWVARLVGINLLRGRARGSRIDIDGGGVIHVPTGSNGAVLVTVHPRSVSLYRDRPQGSPRNVWQARIDHVELSGDRVRVQVGGAPPLVAEVTAAALADLRLQEGDEVWLAFKAADVQAYPR
ncbi:MAG: ABC transporter ATP-binding protein [Euzebya sp.]